MKAFGSERNQPVLLQSADSFTETEERREIRQPASVGPLVFAVALSAFWIGAAGAYVLGYFGPQGLSVLPLYQVVLIVFATLAPPFLMIVGAWALSRGLAMAASAEVLAEATDRLFAADETAARTAARLGRAVRRELDALNAGLDGAFARLRALESVLEKQIASLDEASARADVRAETVAARLTHERERIDAVAASLGEASARASEVVAGRAAQLKAMIESAEGSLRERTDAVAASLGDASARASEVVASRAAQLKGMIESAEGSLRERTDAVAVSLGEASARASEVVAGRAAQLKAVMDSAEGGLRERTEAAVASLGDASARASEVVAGRAAQLRATIESAEGSLKTAGQLLETQAEKFRSAAQNAAEAPQIAAVELDKQAKKIESVADAAMARAEFLLGRHERHRASMGELLQRLKDEASAFESALAKERSMMEQAIGGLSGQAQVFETMAGETERQLESVLAAGSARATQLTASFGREAERVKDISENASASLAKLVTSLHDAGAGAQSLIGETTSQAKTHAKALVGEAMAECDKLVRVARDLAMQSHEVRQALAQAADEVQRHVIALPGVAQQEAVRVREMVKSESEQILDLSARTLSTIHARTSGRQQQVEIVQAEAEPESEGLLGLARKLTMRQPKKKEVPAGEPKSWEMSTLLSNVDSGEEKKDLRPQAAAALGALESALADLAIDLDAINIDTEPTEEDWRRYLAGDRSVFARRIADAIDSIAINRIAILNRENVRFREAADIYIKEFEGLLTRAREGDSGGLLASTMLSADTGKIYLAIAYALGRLQN